MRIGEIYRRDAEDAEKVKRSNTEYTEEKRRTQSTRDCRRAAFTLPRRALSEAF